MLGYPISLKFNYSDCSPFLNCHLNNLGDPFGDIWHYQLNTLKIEKMVIDHVAKLFHAPKDDYWGYVTGGGTEGNLYGLYLARELHPNGIVYYSDQTHYSVPKNLRLLQMKQVKLPSLNQGEIDYDALRQELAHRKEVPIIFANIGTTMKGAVDSIPRINQILTDLNIRDFYIHCDAAFFGMILPFLPQKPSQAFDFQEGIDSIVISGHKMIGSPVPCGVMVTKKSHVKAIGQHIEYVGTKDNTITGSRSGLSPLFLWQALKSEKKLNFRLLVSESIEKADYAIKQFTRYGIKSWRNDNSIIVVFPKPSMKLVKKWQLAVQKEIAHIIPLPHVTKKAIDAFIQDVRAEMGLK